MSRPAASAVFPRKARNRSSHAPKMGVVTRTTTYPLRNANGALAALRAGRFDGAAVLAP
jgi:hypothetical protein